MLYAKTDIQEGVADIKRILESYLYKSQINSSRMTFVKYAYDGRIVVASK